MRGSGLATHCRHRGRHRTRVGRRFPWQEIFAWFNFGPAAADWPSARGREAAGARCPATERVAARGVRTCSAPGDCKVPLLYGPMSDVFSLCFPFLWEMGGRGGGGWKWLL